MNNLDLKYIKMWLKTYIPKIGKVVVSVVTVVAVIACVPALSYIACATLGVIMDVVGSDIYQAVVDGVIKSGSGLSDEEWTASYFEQFYEYIITDYWGLAYGAGGVYNEDGTFNQTYLDATEQQLAMFYSASGFPFDWSAFVLYAKSRRSAELNSESLSASDYVKEHDVSASWIPAEYYKDAVADYNSRYMPHPNEEQYIISYQDTKSEKYQYFAQDSSKTTRNVYFRESVPVYTNTRTWGNRTWSSCYVMGYMIDDDLSTSPYYSQYYSHIYATREDDVVMLHLDIYDLSADKLYSSRECEWDLKKFPCLGFFYCAGAFELYGYSSYADSFSNKSGEGSRVGNSVYSTEMAHVISFLDKIKVLMQNFYQISTFTPESNESDDWGYIVSSKPFELYANQDQIDYNQIPDNYYITISGDTVYDYSVTNPDTGESTTIKNYVNNTYNFPESSGDGGSSGTVSGDVTVSGKVDVSGKIDINTNPIDININVNSGSDGAGEFDNIDISDYIDTLPEQSETMTDYFGIFFDFLPPEFLALMLSGIAVAILCRVLGR